MYRKGFHYKKIISETVWDVYQSEDFERLSETFGLDFSPVCENKDHSATSFQWHHFSGMLVIMGTVTLAGFLWNMCEYIFVYFNKTKSINTKQEVEEKQQTKTAKLTKLVSTNRALAAYLDGTRACDSDIVDGFFSYRQQEQSVEC